VIALEVHKDNQFALDLCGSINHQPTWKIIQGERGFVEALNSSCKTPLAAFSELNKSSGKVKLQYMLSDFEGNFFLFKMMVCPLEESYQCAIRVAREFTILMDEATQALHGLV
jgi:porphobilinogen deaminase